MNVSCRYLLPMLILFGIILVFIVVCKNFLSAYNFDRNILHIANGLFFLISIITFLFQKNALKKTNPHIFVRSVMASMMLKMFICVAAISVYAITAGNSLNKRSVFLALFLYLLYLAVEVISLLKINKQHHA